MPEVLKAQQYFIRCFANLADSLQGRGSQTILNACRKSNAFDRRIVWQFWSGSDHWPHGGLPGQPLGLEPLPVGIKCPLCNLMLSHCLLGIDLAKCLTRLALRFGDWLGRFKLAGCLCHFFAFSRQPHQAVWMPFGDRAAFCQDLFLTSP